MSVPNQTPYIIYNANGITTVFPFEFYIINAGDITATINGEPVTSGYTVSGAGNVGGGDVIFLTPPAAGSVVMLERIVPTYRLTDYQDNGDLLADTVNKDFDRLWMAIQRSFIYLGLALRRPLFGGPFNAEGYRIENLAGPVNNQDAATKHYIDELYAYLVQTVNTAIETIKNGLYGYNEKKSFELGNTLLYLNDILLWESNGQFYRWDGPLPKVVPPGSTPESTGGIAQGRWRNIGDAALRADLASNTGASIVNTSSGKSVQEELDGIKVGYKTPDDFGAVGDGVTNDTAAITAALAYCSQLGIPLRVPAKPYVYNGGTITLPIAIIGDRVPDYNAATNTMTNGSRIIGGMRFSGNQVIIENMGFKRPAGSPGDCLVLSTNNTAGASARVRNIVGAGLSHSDQYHSLLIEGYDAVHASDISGAYNLFGTAIKSRNVVVNGLLTFSCDTGLIIKADAEFSTASNVSVTGHVNVGNGVCSQGIWILATTAQLERINVINPVSTGSAINCRINSTAAVVNDVVISGANYSGATYADFVIDGGASGKLYNVSLNGVSAVNSVKLASVGFCEQLTVSGFYGSITNAATVNTAFEVSSGVGLFVGSSMHLAVNYGANLAGLSLGKVRTSS